MENNNLKMMAFKKKNFWNKKRIFGKYELEDGTIVYSDCQFTESDFKSFRSTKMEQYIYLGYIKKFIEAKYMTVEEFAKKISLSEK